MHGDQVPIGADEQTHLYNSSSYEFHEDQTITMNFSGNMLKDEWILIDNGNLLHIDGQTGVYYKIQQLDEEKLTIYHDYDIGQGPSRRTFYLEK